MIIKNCHRLTSLFSLSLAEKMQRLQMLQIYGCHELRQIITDTYARCLPKLITIEITDCGSLEYVFEISVSSFSPKLKKLHISGCPRLNGVVQVGDEHNVDLPQLQTLKITNCGLLEYVFKITTALFAPNLEYLHISSCPKLCGVIEAGGRYIELPHLKTLNITECDLLEYVLRITNSWSVPMLKFLNISHCPQLNGVFQVGDEYFAGITISALCAPQLDVLDITSCPQLKRLFEVRNADNCYELPQLTMLKINGCGSLEYVISTALSAPKLLQLDISDCSGLDRLIEVGNIADNNYRFPQLKRLALKSLNNLTTFCQGVFSIGLPSLENLEVEACPRLLNICKTMECSELKELSLFDVKKELCEDVIKHQGGYFLSSLENLTLQAVLIQKDLCEFVTLQNLIHLKVVKCNKLTKIFSIVLARNLLQLRRLEVQGCEELEHIVVPGRISSSPSPIACHKTVIFPKLEEIFITECNKLKSLFPVNASCIPKLRKIQVKDASNLKEIFGHDREAKMTNNEKLTGVWLPELKELFFENLSKLNGFASVVYDFEFPALISIRVAKCPRIKSIRFRFNDDSDNSYVRADIKDRNSDVPITMQDIGAKDEETITWDHPGNQSIQ